MKNVTNAHRSSSCCGSPESSKEETNDSVAIRTTLVAIGVICLAVGVAAFLTSSEGRAVFLGVICEVTGVALVVMGLLPKKVSESEPEAESATIKIPVQGSSKSTRKKESSEDVEVNYGSEAQIDLAILGWCEDLNIPSDEEDEPMEEISEEEKSDTQKWAEQQEAQKAEREAAKAEREAVKAEREAVIARLLLLWEGSSNDS